MSFINDFTNENVLLQLVIQWRDDSETITTGVIRPDSSENVITIYKGLIIEHKNDFGCEFDFSNLDEVKTYVFQYWEDNSTLFNVIAELEGLKCYEDD